MGKEIFNISTRTIVHPSTLQSYRETIETCKRLGVEFKLHSFDLDGELDPEILPSEFRQNLISTGPPELKAQIVSRLSQLASNNFSSLIDPTSVIASSASIGCGVHIDALSAVASETKISCHVRVNRLSSIGHDVFLEPFTYIGPAAVVCGHAHTGFGAVVGAGAVILPKVHIGDNTLIGAGSVVTKDIPSNSVAYGNPARVMSTREPWGGITQCPFCQ